VLKVDVHLALQPLQGQPAETAELTLGEVNAMLELYLQKIVQKATEVRVTAFLVAGRGSQYILSREDDPCGKDKIPVTSKRVSL
jgi:hypothetical protein